jgi:diguanylate cyclase (GGDEF)-like protein
MNQQLLDKIKNVPQLPSLPAVAVRVLELAKQNNQSLANVAKVISGDPALTAKVLKTVNSSFYGLPHQVSTINHALVLLGMQTVKTLALGFSLAGSLNSNKSVKFDYVRFWRQSLFSAVAARTLAKSIRMKEPEEAFLVGLLSDIGTLAMHRALGAEYDQLLDACAGDQSELVRLSRQKFDLDHAQVGGAMAEHWKFPQSVVQPICHHHDLAPGTYEPGSLMEIVYTGVLCGQVFAAKRPGIIERAKKELSTRFKLEETRIAEIFREINAQATELSKLFEVTIEPARSFQEIEQEARQVLEEISLQSQAQTRSIEMLNQKLKTEATIDGLTGLANRHYFDELITKAFEDAVRSAQPLSLLFLDLDKFKSINDTYGHQAGDSVLQFTAKVIKSLIEDPHLVARYGGEEISIILKGKDSSAAHGIAEQIRKAIENESMTFARKKIPVTASIGVATVDAQRRFSSPDELIGAADRGVYAAKNAGRNCVRMDSSFKQQRGAA